MNNRYVSFAHAHAKATAEQNRVRFIGALVSCTACTRAKENRAPPFHHNTARTKRPMELVPISTAVPFPAPPRGSRFVVKLVGSASRLQHTYCKSATGIVAVRKRFVADIGVSREFRSENGKKYANRVFVDFCNNLGIRREVTPPFTPQQNGPAFGSFQDLHVNPSRGSKGLHGCGGDMAIDGVATLGLGVFRSVSYIGELRLAFPPTKCFVGVARRCSYYRFPSRRTSARSTKNRTQSSRVLILGFRLQSRA